MKRVPEYAGIILVVTVACLCGCAGGGSDSTEAQVPEEALEKARTAADGLTSELKQRLLGAMSEGGPVAAIEVCSVAAPQIAAAHSAAGVTVRRVSDRARNPRDLPDEWERGMLATLEERHEAGDLPDEIWEAVTAPGGERELRYLRPISVGPMCLNCHGDSTTIPEDVATRIREIYPEDRAVGYQAGDLRGAVSVTVPLGG